MFCCLLEPCKQLLTVPCCFTYATHSVMQDQFLASLGISDYVDKLGSSIGWAGVMGVVVAAAILTLGIGFMAYHFRMRYHAQQQIKDIMCASCLSLLYLSSGTTDHIRQIAKGAHASQHHICMLSEWMLDAWVDAGSSTCP